jgi:hypothetical protein
MIYARPSPDLKYNPDGTGGTYKARDDHGSWHIDPEDGTCATGGAACKWRIQDCANSSQCIPTQTYDSDLFTKGMRGEKFFTYHKGIIDGHLWWRGVFDVTTTLDPAVGPAPATATRCHAGSRDGASCTTDDNHGTTGCPGATCPGCCVPFSYLTAAGGRLPSPLYNYVRLGEYESVEHLGDDVERWHAAGHVDLGGDMQQQFTAAGSVVNHFWRWHARVEQLRQDYLAITPATDRASVSATDPANGATVANGRTTVAITFNKPVSTNADADNKAQTKPAALEITKPGGGTVAVASVGTSDYLTHTFTVAAMTDAGAYTAKLTGTARGYLGDGATDAHTFSFAVAAP